MQAEHNSFAMMVQKLGGARSQKKHNRNWQQQRFTLGISNKKFNPSNNNDNMFSSNTGHAPVNWQQQRFSSSPPLQKYILENKNGYTGTPTTNIVSPALDEFLYGRMTPPLIPMFVRFVAKEIIWHLTLSIGMTIIIKSIIHPNN